MSVGYKTYGQLNLPNIGEEILQLWAATNAFEKSVSLREGKTPFVFYEGPPSANGMPGIHHVISRTLKDLVCRYKTMQGFQVKRKGGWDTHGLPIELGVEKMLGITKEDIGTKISVEDYNKKCREVVMQFKDKWDDITQKMGYWVDLEKPYVTFENNYIETLWWCLSQLYKKDYLYESVSIQPYSPAAGTGLSSHELNQPGTYKDVKDTSATVMFKAYVPPIETGSKNLKIVKLYELLAEQQENKFEEVEIFFMAWTTTPWTLPSNLGLTVGPNIDYVLVKTFNPYTNQVINIILAKSLIGKYFREEGLNADFELFQKQIDEDNKFKWGLWIPYKIIAEFKGSELEGVQYEQLLPSDANTIEKIQEITPDAQPFRVILGDFVTTEDGTGIVHTAPAFGADDYRVGKKNNLGILTLVDREGKFVEGMGDFSGRYVKNYKDEKDYVDVNVDISVKLKYENRAFKVEKYEHSYPHCWRTDKPIIYYPLDAWFIKTTAAKDTMVELNKTINWKPASTGTGRFGNWLENMVDWNLSRSRFWGTPLPIWKCGEVDLEIDTEVHGTDRSFMDDKRFTSPYDQICVGQKNDLIKTNAKGNENLLGHECEGFYVDFEKLNEDIIGGNQDLKLAIEGRNKSISPYGFESIKEMCIREGRFNKKTLKTTGYTLSLIEKYITKIDEDFLKTFDLHKPFIDNVVFCRQGNLENPNLYFRVDDLIDVWFDSGAMPYAQWGLPDASSNEYGELSTENFWKYHAKDKNSELYGGVENAAFPADFIAEGVDQTRGWFYTLHALGSLLFGSVAYKTVVSNGLVLDKNGNKMSKRLGNVVDPFGTINSYGADATRWYLITNASPWDSLKFDEAGIQEIQRKFFGTLYNTYQFFALYANVDSFAFKEKYIPVNERPEIDQWILSSLNSLIKVVTENFDAYEPTQAGRAIEEFVDSLLSNWYVRLCRRRFWKGEYEHDKIAAYQTLYECLETISKLIAPIAPFFAEWLFSNLNAATGRMNDASVHHSLYPACNDSIINVALEKRMQLAQDTSSLVLSLRKKVNIKVRQPLQKIFIPAQDAEMVANIKLIEDIIKTETNIKEIDILAADNDFIRKKAKANFKTLGKRLGAKMKWAATEIEKMDDATIAKVQEGNYMLKDDNIAKDDEQIILNAEDIEVITDEIPGYEIAIKGPLTVALDITITDELQKEGNAREFVNKLQTIRKESGFELTDRISVQIAENEDLKTSIMEYKSYICAEILADSIEFVPQIIDGMRVEVNESILTVTVLKK
jgi:isoleucyl-tRNA synthetase